MDTVKSIVGTVQAQLTDQASLIYDQVKSAITIKLDKVMPKKVEITQEPASPAKPADSFDSPPAEPEDPDSFSFSRILDMVWYYIKKFIYPLLCVLMASFIANEMIMYAPIIRFAFFTFFLLVCLSSTGILSSMCAYYLLKLLYGIYVNKMTDRPKIKLLPTVYSMLPLMVDRPLLPIAALFLYPFTYPKTQVDEKALLETMALYQKDLDRSYPAVSADVMPDKVEKAKEYLKHMHDTPKQTEQKGYIEELNKIVPNPGKFHAPIGKMQIEARERAAVAIAASMQSQPQVQPVTLYPPQRDSEQVITNAISSLKRTIHRKENDQATTIKKIEKYGEIRNGLTAEQKSEIEKRGYVFNDDNKGGTGFIDTKLPTPQPEKRELYIPAGIDQKSTTVKEAAELKEKQEKEAAALKEKEDKISSWKNKAAGMGSSVRKAPVSTLPPVIASTQQASAPQTVVTPEGSLPLQINPSFKSQDPLQTPEASAPPPPSYNMQGTFT
jgi:hypothetical protein